MKRLLVFFSFLVLFAASGSLCVAQDMASFEKRVTVKRLANGLTVVICERPEAPVVSFFTHVDVGDAQDPKGQTGLAHMFEHMAFKGTDKIGSTNWPAEKAALQKVERAYQEYDRERIKEVGRDEQRIAATKKAWEDAREAADKYVVTNQYDEILERNGAEGMNASTSEDETQYFYSLPSNRIELWAYMESERFLHPVFREFYKERDVVHEERRMRVDSSPIGRLVEQFQAASFVLHPYHNEGIGDGTEIDSLSATDAQKFFDKYYVPANMVVAIVGDVKAKQIMPIVEKYFGRLPARPAPEPLHVVEPQQRSERTVTLFDTAQPIYLEGYHKPDFRDPDDAVYDVLSDLFSNGRTSRLYRALVRDKKIAVVAEGFSGFPGNKYPNLFAFYAVPSRGHTPEELQAAMHEEIDRMVNQDVSDEELQMVKTRAKADLIRGLANNDGLAQQLGVVQAYYGDWRELFRQVDRIEKVTKADIRRVAAKTFTRENRTTAVLENNATASNATSSNSKSGAKQ
jgi:predicted Zn-dependent peptidase